MLPLLSFLQENDEKKAMAVYINQYGKGSNFRSMLYEQRVLYVNRDLKSCDEDIIKTAVNPPYT